MTASVPVGVTTGATGVPPAEPVVGVVMVTTGVPPEIGSVPVAVTGLSDAGILVAAAGLATTRAAVTESLLEVLPPPPPQATIDVVQIKVEATLRVMVLKGNVILSSSGFRIQDGG
jgi:hypothetical protein